VASGALPRCGRISYTNDLPVYAAFDAGALDFPGTLHAGVPAELNRALLAGELDISPISSFFYIEHASDFQLLPYVCIGSHGAVKSVCCVSDRHPRDLAGARIAVTRESATGRALFEVICRKWYGFVPAYDGSDDPFAHYRDIHTPALIIGDAAIDASLAVPAEHTHDVGLLWRERTGLGMVYAVWAARNAYVDEHADRVAPVMHALRDSLRWSEAHMPLVIAAAQEQRQRPQGFYEAYYEALDFHFRTPSDTMQHGMTAFFTLAAEQGLLDSAALLSSDPRRVISHA
jgi:chorismate dehydratase